MKKITTIAACFAATCGTAAPITYGQSTPTTADTQQKAGDQLKLEEVVVTAMRRGDEALQKVPAAISVVSPTDLDQKGLGSLQDIVQTLPSVSLQSQGAGNNLIAIRGLSVFALDLTNSQERSLVAVYLDDTPINLQSANPDLQVYDLERVEVIRGPQGTLYGASAMAGSIRYVTKKPDLDDFGGSADSSLSYTDHGGTNYSVRGALNLPLVKDQLAVRLNGFRNENSGFIDNITGGPRGNDNASTQGRVALRWTPTGTLSLDASVTMLNMLSHGLDETFSELGPYTDSALTQQRFDDAFRLYNLTADWTPPAGQLISSTSYIARNLTQHLSVQWETAGLLGLNLPSDSTLSYDIHSFTEEIRWLSPSDQKLKTTLGAFYEHSSKYIPQTLPTPGLDAALGVNSVVDYGTPTPDDFFYGTINIDERQFAFFGEATYPILPKLDLTLGARYFTFDERFNLFFTGVGGALAPGVPSTQSGAEKPSGVNPRAVLAYNLTDSVMIFGEAARGFRYGGVNEPVPPDFCAQSLAQIGLSSAPVTFGPDHVWSYTLGEKGTFMDGRLRANLDGFLIDWSDVQTIKNLTCGYYFAQNKGDVQSKGIELESDLRVTTGLTVGLSGSFTDATAPGAIQNLNASSGDRVPYFPRTIVNLHGNYQIPLSVGKLTLAADLTYRGSEYTDFSPADPLYREIPASRLLNSTMTFEQGQWQIALFGTNLTNNRLISDIQANTFGSIQPGDRVYIGRPRTIGIRAHVAF